MPGAVACLMQPTLDWVSTGRRRETPLCHPVPPKYTSFQRGEYWRLGGKLYVPRERFILYPGAERESDPTTCPGLGRLGSPCSRPRLSPPKGRGRLALPTPPPLPRRAGGPGALAPPVTDLGCSELKTPWPRGREVPPRAVESHNAGGKGAMPEWARRAARDAGEQGLPLRCLVPCDCGRRWPNDTRPEMLRQSPVPREKATSIVSCRA